MVEKWGFFGGYFWGSKNGGFLSKKGVIFGGFGPNGGSGPDFGGSDGWPGRNREKLVPTLYNKSKHARWTLFCVFLGPFLALATLKSGQKSVSFFCTFLGGSFKKSPKKRKLWPKKHVFLQKTRFLPAKTGVF